MNALVNKTTSLAFAVSMILAGGGAWADNTITFEADSLNNGTGNYGDIQATGTGANTVSIYQVGSGDSTVAAEQNQVGTSASKLILDGNGTATAHIGQGGYWNGTVWTKSKAVQNNIVKGTITTGEVEVSQNSGDASHANSITLNVNGGGKVTVNQGDITATSTAGHGLTASVTQTGSGAVTINQGNSADSAVTSGTATVVHAGSHTVSITQNDGTNANVGLVQTNTTGDGGALTITHSNSGNTFVDANGNGTGAAATITGTATLVNSGTGDVGLKSAVGNVYANKNGSGDLTIDQSGSGNTYVNTSGDSTNLNVVTINGTVDLVNSGAGDLKVTAASGNAYANISGGNLTIHDVGTGNNIYVNAAGNNLNAAPGMSGGNLTLNGDGAGNVIKVTNFQSGTVTVNQGNSMNDSTLALTSAVGMTGTVILNQNGDFQDAVVHSANNSTGTFNLNEVGAAIDNRATVNLTF